MMFRIAAVSTLILVPFAGFAQEAPAEVDKALRARVTLFCQAFVDKTYRKAEALVAEDTKDEFYAMQKTPFLSFTVDTIDYGDHFTKAVVNVSAKRRRRISPQFPEVEMVDRMRLDWKIVDGEWFFFHNPEHRAAPTSAPTETAVAPPSGQSGNTSQLEKPDLSPQAIAKRGQSIMDQKPSVLDKSEVQFVANKNGSDKVVFHNGAAGSVQLVLNANGKPSGLNAELDKTVVPAGGDAVLKLNYTPANDGSAPKDYTVTLYLQPFNQAFPVNVKFVASR